MKFKRGDQIAYIPTHADDVHHPDTELGFVTSVSNKFVFCRFWGKNMSLRTLANSEAVNPDDLIHWESVADYKIKALLAFLEP